MTQANLGQVLASAPMSELDRLLQRLSQANAPKPGSIIEGQQQGLMRKATGKAPGRLRGMNQFQPPIDAFR